jgi:glucokinase
MKVAFPLLWSIKLSQATVLCGKNRGRSMTDAEVAVLGDIGATNARLAFLADGTLGPVKWIEVARYAKLTDAVWEFLQGKRTAATALFAVAAPVEGQRANFTNSPWTIDGRELQDRFKFQTVRIINDFEATALSLPHLMEEDLRPLGGGRAEAGAPMVALGPGSGLGVAGLVGDGSCRTVVPSEGGHATLAAASPREDAVLDHLRQRFGHVSAERALSGPGLENLYQAIIALDEIDLALRNAAQITDAALKGTCATSRAALDMFCGMLGSFAGNVALTYGARGGVYIAGGIAPRILDYLAASEFRRRFEQKGRLQKYLKSIPSQVIVHPAATFLGLQSLCAGP